MRINRLMGSVLLGLSGALAGATEPSSPARAQLDGFLAAFNSGDRAKVEAFGRDHAPPQFSETRNLDHTMWMFDTTGGFEVLDVEESSAHALNSRVRERKSGNVQQLVIEVDPATPDRIKAIQLTVADPPADVGDKQRK